MPLSLVGAFGLMYLMGFSLNNLTLMALTISTGFVVDDAVVMIENISRYMEEGETPLPAALEGIEPDRFHDSVFDGFADRGSDSSAVHGRRRRQALPGICHHLESHDPGLGRRFADPDANDVRETAAA